MSEEDINFYVPSLLNPKTFKVEDCNSLMTPCSMVGGRTLSLRKNKRNTREPKANIKTGKENIQHTNRKILERSNIICDGIPESNLNGLFSPKLNKVQTFINEYYDFKKSSRRETDVHTKISSNRDFDVSQNDSFQMIETNETDKLVEINNTKLEHINNSCDNEDFDDLEGNSAIEDISCIGTITFQGLSTFLISDSITLSGDRVMSETENPFLTEQDKKDSSPDFSIPTFQDNEYQCVYISSSNSDINNKENENINDAIETSQSEIDTIKQAKRSAISVDLEVKRRKLSVCDGSTSFNDSRVLCLKTNAIDQLSHATVRQLNYKIVKRQILTKIKRKSVRSSSRLCNKLNECVKKNCSVGGSVNDVDTSKCDDMNKSLDVSDNILRAKKAESPKSSPLKSDGAQRRHDVKSSAHNKITLPPKTRRDISNSAPIQRKKTNSLEYLTSNRIAEDIFSKIPHHKIVAGTHFAVDAFSYGDIKHVKHYFLTHFHSDHYAGLKKSFNKILLCSKITADLCTSRLGVNSRYIQILANDETIKIEGVEVTAVEANHCPGAIMLVFTLPSGKTILHTGDFRASYIMESYPIFWNKDIYTVYLDTTYCNPRYDFPSQDESIDMAFDILKEKKKAVERLGGNFSTVLVVCGTYTIGKEKFFMGVARRIGCTVWACSGKDSILQTVEDRSYSQMSSVNCQLHVMPMRDITHEKLRNHLDSLKGTFTEVVAFKPSGWENTKKSPVEKDLVTIYGIPYSEHSSFSELLRFVKFLKPRQVVPTVDIPGGIKNVQKHFPCPLVHKEDNNISQSKISDFFNVKEKPA